MLKLNKTITTIICIYLLHLLYNFYTLISMIIGFFFLKLGFQTFDMFKKLDLYFPVF